MCNPMVAVAVMAAISMVTMKMQQDAQAKQADKQEGLLKDQARQQEFAAEQAHALDSAALKQREAELQSKTLTDVAERRKQAAREEAMLRVASAEAGVLGNSVDRQLLASVLGAGYDVGIIKENQENALAQLNLEQKKLDASLQSRRTGAGSLLKQADLIKSSLPSGFGSFLQIAGAGAGGAAKGYSLGTDLSNLTTTTIPNMPAR